MVPMGQWMGLGERLKGKGVGGGEEEKKKVECTMVVVSRDHDEMWREGSVLARFMAEILEGTVARLKGEEGKNELV